jgi:hypothetical protein
MGLEKPAKNKEHITKPGESVKKKLTRLKNSVKKILTLVRGGNYVGNIEQS